MFWFGLGVAAGVAVARKVNQAAKQVTPVGIAANVGEGLRELAGAVGAFGAEVRAGMAEREQELQETVARQTGVVPGRLVSDPYATPYTGQVERQPARRARRAGG
jgi:chromosome condensin MukBEF MukE localization factor